MLKPCLGPRIFVLIHLKTTCFPDKPSYKRNCMGVNGISYEFILSIQPFGSGLSPSRRVLQCVGIRSAI